MSVYQFSRQTVWTIKSPGLLSIPIKLIMFAKIVLFLLIASSTTSAQYLAAAPAYAAAYPSVYSPYVYSGYAAAYPAFYGWGSNKGAAPSSGPAPGGKLTNNQ